LVEHLVHAAFQLILIGEIFGVDGRIGGIVVDIGFTAGVIAEVIGAKLGCFQFDFELTTRETFKGGFDYEGTRGRVDRRYPISRIMMGSGSCAHGTLGTVGKRLEGWCGRDVGGKTKLFRGNTSYDHTAVEVVEMTVGVPELVGEDVVTDLRNVVRRNVDWLVGDRGIEDSVERNAELFG